MSSEDRPFRVALAAQSRSEHLVSSFLGVLHYTEQATHWRLSGLVHHPVLSFGEVDLAAIDGLIGFFRNPQAAERFVRAGVPAVNFSSAVEEVHLPRVGHDDEAIGRLGAEHLLERGLRRFGFVGDERQWYSRRRLAGFRDALEDASAATPDVLNANVAVERYDQALREWLEPLPKPIGVMTANDWRAVYLVQTAQQLGLRIPEDVAVVGVDNDSWLTQLTQPRLSSIEPDWHRVGYVAAQMLDELMRGETPTPRLWIKPKRLVARGSTEVLAVENPVVGKAMDFIRRHCAEPIKVEDVLAKVGVSRRNLEHRFKRTIGLSPHAAICRARVDLAKHMLTQTDALVDEITTACGFGTPNQLRIVFKRLTGMSPGHYRRAFGDR